MVYAWRMGGCHVNYKIKYGQGSTGGSRIGRGSSAHYRPARQKQTQPTSVCI